jgi:hypothetical protein
MACAREALGTPRFSVVLDASLTRDRKSTQVLVDRIEAGRRMLHPYAQTRRSPGRASTGREPRSYGFVGACAQASRRLAPKPKNRYEERYEKAG